MFSTWPGGQSMIKYWLMAIFSSGVAGTSSSTNSSSPDIDD
jgi:hypothetical protein